jgi:hypothetical protein
VGCRPFAYEIHAFLVALTPEPTGVGLVFKEVLLGNQNERAALGRCQLTPGLISSLPARAGSLPFISPPSRLVKATVAEIQSICGIFLGSLIQNQAVRALAGFMKDSGPLWADDVSVLSEARI